MHKKNIEQKFGLFSDHWRPKIIAELNGQEVRLVKAKGTDFPWHHHEDADEMFLIWRGNFRLEFRDGSVDLGPGDLIVVPRGVEHRPVAVDEVELLLFEPASVVNTGDVHDEEFTAPLGARV
jgi:mannose-6-phosphate isomerase-like protein (cupin superfamily)